MRQATHREWEDAVREFDFDERTRDYSKKNARWLGKASQIAYNSSDKGRDELKKPADSRPLNSGRFITMIVTAYNKASHDLIQGVSDFMSKNLTK